MPTTNTEAIHPLASPAFRLMAKDARGTDYVVRTGFVLDVLDEAEAANALSREQWVVDESGVEVRSSPSLLTLRQLLPARYQSLVQLQASSPAEVWLNAHLYALALKVKSSHSALSKEVQMINWLEGMTPAERLDFAQRHMGDGNAIDAPTYRLWARDQSNGREYLMRYGFLVDLLREARLENARNKDYWVVNHAGIEIDWTGRPVEEQVADAAGERPGASS